MRGVHLDNRWSPLDQDGVKVKPKIIDYLKPGCGYGGSCLPKDVMAISALAQDFGISAPILSSVIEVNERQPSMMLDILKKRVSDLDKKDVLLLGLSFKPDTDDIRESSSLKLIPLLHKSGALISYYDPSGEKINFKKYKNVSFKSKISHACKNSDLIILHTEWNEFKNLNFKKLVKKRNFIIYDLRNIYSHKKMINSKINYFAIGR